MSSSNALRRDINVSSSLYQGIAILFLYCFPLTIIASVFQSFLAYALCLVFFLIALYLAFKASQKTSFFTITEDGNIALMDNKQSSIQFSIQNTSFYNALFLYISLAHKKGIIDKKSKKPAHFIIFKDSICEQDYRLIARLINQT